MDAATISILCETLKKNFKDEMMNLITIHDCFATDGNHVSLIHFYVKTSFLQIYQDQEFINHFYSFFIEYLEKKKAT
jgi:DNA-dependent RNA polymerase